LTFDDIYIALVGCNNIAIYIYILIAILFNNNIFIFQDFRILTTMSLVFWKNKMLLFLIANIISMKV